MSFPLDALDPWVRQMREAESDVARADVLLTAPVSTLMRLQHIFLVHCRRCRFDEGEEYLEALAETQRKPRHRGNLAGTTRMASATTRLFGVIDRGGRTDG